MRLNSFDIRGKADYPGRSFVRARFSHSQHASGRSITFLNLLSYFIIIIQDVFLKGIGLAVLWPQLPGLALLGIALLTLSVLRFQKRLA